MYETPQKDYYLWKKDTSPQNPWDRMFRNDSFYEYENQRIVEATNWINSLRLKKLGAKLDEISFYVLPIHKLKYQWEAALAETKPNHSYRYLSSLRNSAQNVIVALFPPKTGVPEEYRLIRIIESKVDFIQNSKLKILERAVLIEKWEYLPDESVYVDIPKDRKVLFDVLHHTLGKERTLTLGFQSPILSAPYVPGDVGGVSLSSIATNSYFTQELIRNIQLMVPPELREASPPKKSFVGTSFEEVNGILGWVAERPSSQNKFVGVYQNFDYLNNQLNRRKSHNGEFSIFSSIGVRGTGADATLEFLRDFMKTEIAIPTNIDGLQSTDVNLHTIRKQISEDLWAQVAKARQYNPIIIHDKDYVERVRKLTLDLDAKFVDIYRNDTIRSARAHAFIPQLRGNVERVAQSIARAKNQNELTDVDWKDARGLIMDNITSFSKHPYFSKVFAAPKYAGTSNPRILDIQTFLLSNPGSTREQMWEQLKSSPYLKDIFDMEELLQWLNTHGYILITNDKRIYWD